MYRVQAKPWGREQAVAQNLAGACNAPVFWMIAMQGFWYCCDPKRP